MPRDALPQWEIDVILARLKHGERLEDISARMRDVEPSWFTRNEADLLRAAGIPPSPVSGEAASSPPPEEPEPIADLPDPVPVAEPHRKAKKHGKGR